MCGVDRAGESRERGRGRRAERLDRASRVGAERAERRVPRRHGAGTRALLKVYAIHVLPVSKLSVF